MLKAHRDGHSGVTGNEQGPVADCPPCTGRDTTLCGRVPFPERSHCVDRFGFPGPRESANPISGSASALYGAVYRNKCE